MRGVLVLAVALTLSDCHSSSRPSATQHPSGSTTVTTGSTPSTSAGAQTSGVRTVLSPLGLNIRAQPVKTAAIVRTAAQGTELTVVAHTDQDGGWFQVKGTTVTGWISDNPKLTAPGTFSLYTQSQNAFAALYPDKWTVVDSAPASVVFHPESGSDTVVVTTATTVAQLGRGRAGYRQSNDEPVVVCGITGDLLTFTQVSTPSTATSAPGGVAAEPYLVQVHLKLDAQHALGIDADVADTSHLQTVRNFVSSVKFPFPQCQQ
jgi:hypothetical protein